MKNSSKNISKLIQNVKAGNIPTPSYVIDESMLINNLKILKSVEERSGCQILLAQKAYSVYQTYPLIKSFISGATASGLYEAKLGYEYMKGENHVFSPAYKEDEFNEILDICDHVIFNSFREWDRHKAKVIQSIENKKNVEFGIRINPCYSTQDHPIYDPCAYGSRFGVKKEDFRFDDMEEISGVHFHTLCEQNADDLISTLKVVERDFAPALKQVKWVNFGGGHHITRNDYDIESLIQCIKKFKETYDVQVYLEPGEAVVLDAGYMVSQILDITSNGIKTAILDVSAACHMPDIIEMPYTPKVIAVCNERINKNTAIYGIGNEEGNNNCKIGDDDRIYRFGGNTCLAGDVFGDYEFDNPLNVGDYIIFFDLALYSMVKNNTFNGMALPSILYMKQNGDIEKIKEFGYEDFKVRL